MDSFQAYHIVRIGALASMLAFVAYLWSTTWPAWEAVASMVRGHELDPTTSGIVATALMAVILCCAGRSGPYRTSRPERYALVAACVLVMALVAWMASMLYGGPVHLYGPALIGCVAVCVLMSLRITWTLRSGHIVDGARMQ